MASSTTGTAPVPGAETSAAATTGARRFRPKKHSAAAAEATVAAATTGAVQLSPEEALTAAAAESTAAQMLTAGATSLSPEEALTAAAAESTAAAGTPTTAPQTGPVQTVALGLGYIPNVQFAPFYVASSKGYYAAEGLAVDFSYGGNVNDLLLQTATGQLPFVMAAGDEVLLARSQGIPIKMTSLVFQQVPVAVFSKASAGIATPCRLARQDHRATGTVSARRISRCWACYIRRT